MTVEHEGPTAHPPTGAARRRAGRRRLVAAALPAAGLSLVLTLVGLPASQPEAEAAPPRTSTKTLKVKSTSGDKRVAREDKGQGSQRRAAGKVLDRVVAALPEQNTDTFSTVGVTWAGQSSGTDPDVQVRTKAVKGGWSDWETISDGEAVEGGNGLRATEPVYVGDVDGVEVRALGDESTKLSDVQVVMVDSPTVASDSDPATYSTTAATDLYPRPPIVSRAGWGADESWRCNERKMGDTIKAAVVHHTAGSNSYSSSQSPSIIRGIYSYHTKTLGWCDIGYNFLVDKYGKIYEGRHGGITRPVHGAHAADWNTDTVGVSFMGNYETARPPAVMMEAGAKVLAWKLDAFQRVGYGSLTLAGKKVRTIFRHGDVMSTVCPGRHITAEMDNLRHNVQRKVGARGPIWDAWIDRGGWTSYGYPHVAEEVVGSGRMSKFIDGNRFKNLYWHPTYGSASVENSIRNRYQLMGETSSPLGWPRTDQRSGPLAHSQMNYFAKGRIVWRGDVGAWPLYGGFDGLFTRLGGYRENLGAPKSDHYLSAVRPGMVKQSFTNGRMYYLKAYGSNAVYGGIGVKYRELGSEASKLGAPTSSEYSISGGRANDFEHGRITWNSSTGDIKVTYT